MDRTQWISRDEMLLALEYALDRLESDPYNGPNSGWYQKRKVAWQKAREQLVHDANGHVLSHCSSEV